MQNNEDFDLKKLEDIIKNKNLKDSEKLKAWELEIEKIKKFGWLFLILIFFGPIIELVNFLNLNNPMIYFVIFLVVLLILSIKQINQYEKGLKFSFGKFSGIMEPGWRIVIPIFQSYQKVDMRVKAVDVPDQEAITKDNISVRVNAVIYYRVKNAERAVLEVENFFFAVSQLAQTTMRNVTGEVNLDELLSKRDETAEKIRNIVDKATDAWGIEVQSVELKDVNLPEEMKRVIGKQAEAEREKRSVIIKAEGEVIASENLAKAAKTLSETDGALHLRTLNTLNDLSSDQSNTVIFAVPLEILRAFERLGKK